MPPLIKSHCEGCGLRGCASVQYCSVFTSHKPGIKPISLARRLHHTDTHLRTYTHTHFPTVQQVWDVGNGWCAFPFLPILACIVHSSDELRWLVEGWHWSDNKEDQAIEGQGRRGRRYPLVTTEGGRKIWDHWWSPLTFQLIIVSSMSSCEHHAVYLSVIVSFSWHL